MLVACHWAFGTRPRSVTLGSGQTNLEILEGLQSPRPPHRTPCWPLPPSDVGSGLDRMFGFWPFVMKNHFLRASCAICVTEPEEKRRLKEGTQQAGGRQRPKLRHPRRGRRASAASHRACRHQCDPLGPCVAAQCPRSSLCVGSQPLPARLVPGGVAGLTLQVGVNSVAREAQARGLGRAVPFQSLPFSLGGRQCDPPGVRRVQSAASRGPPSPRGP